MHCCGGSYQSFRWDLYPHHSDASPYRRAPPGEKGSAYNSGHKAGNIVIITVFTIHDPVHGKSSTEGDTEPLSKIATSLYFFVFIGFPDKTNQVCHLNVTDLICFFLSAFYTAGSQSFNKKSLTYNKDYQDR